MDPLAFSASECEDLDSLHCRRNALPKSSSCVRTNSANFLSDPLTNEGTAKRAVMTSIKACPSSVTISINTEGIMRSRRN